MRSIVLSLSWTVMKPGFLGLFICTGVTIMAFVKRESKLIFSHKLYHNRYTHFPISVVMLGIVLDFF